MSPIRNLTCCVASASYLLVAAAPCPVPDSQDGTFAPRAAAREEVVQVGAEAEHARNAHNAHMNHSDHHDVGAVVHPSADHAHHAASVASATSRVASTTALSPQCPCGCGGKKKSEAAGGKLGPRALFAGGEVAFTAFTVRVSAWQGDATSQPARPPVKVPISFLVTHTFS